MGESYRIFVFGYDSEDRLDWTFFSYCADGGADGDADAKLLNGRRYKPGVGFPILV